MEPIKLETAQAALQAFIDRPVYLHLETTNGAYAATSEHKTMAICAYIRNGLVRVNRATIAGKGPFRAGLQIDLGWIYAEGLTDFEVDAQGRLLMAGHDADGRLAIALELSSEPFPT